jgi:hypothetical protein
MNPVEHLINTFGALTELWMVAYKGFIGQGLTPDDAMRHTREFMGETLKVMMNYKEEK